MLKKLFCIILLSNYGGLSAKVILWDLGGVLFQPDKLGVAQEIGLSHFASYALFDMKNPNIERVLFDVLEQMENQSGATARKRAQVTALRCLQSCAIGRPE